MATLRRSSRVAICAVVMLVSPAVVVRARARSRALAPGGWATSIGRVRLVRGRARESRHLLVYCRSWSSRAAGPVAYLLNTHPFLLFLSFCPGTAGLGPPA